MATERRRNDLVESTRNALSGYAVVVLGVVCFLLSLAALTIVVRIIVGASAGTGA